uniref:VWFD domain-containing protein n=1 Tax=Fundulus heteroclitus TaxID=8078 RepID=A0A3Q2Q9U3_FUNHE
VKKKLHVKHVLVYNPSQGTVYFILNQYIYFLQNFHFNYYLHINICGLCGNFDSSEMNDLRISVVSSPLAFGNSWKTATPPCTDVTTEIFPCERNSYCSAWAQRRCLILKGDAFKDCHLKVDPEPYYHACVQESCSCEFEGKFLGYCTAVAAYADACSDQNICIDWRTPDLCPVYCDYYNERDQCRWHYEACGTMLTCGKDNNFHHKLEGDKQSYTYFTMVIFLLLWRVIAHRHFKIVIISMCSEGFCHDFKSCFVVVFFPPVKGCYPRCPKEMPYFDEHTGRCTQLTNCSCYFNETIVPPGEGIVIDFVLW